MDDTAEEKLHGGRRPSEVTTPTEGGWGWMVVAGCFLSTICIRAVTRCVSLFFVEFQLHFEKDYASTAWTHSLVDCTTMLCAPLGGFLASRFSCRVTVMLGGLLSSAGLVLSSFASSLEFLYVSLGIVTGVGFALSYSPAVAMVGRYFSERKALAYGVAMSGNGIGTFVLAPAVQLLMEHYGWRGALLVLAGLVSNLCVCGALMRPPPTGRPRILETGGLDPAGPARLSIPPGVLASFKLQQLVRGPKVVLGDKLTEATLGGGGGQDPRPADGGRAEEPVESGVETGGSGPPGDQRPGGPPPEGPSSRGSPGSRAEYGFLLDPDFLLLCVSFLLLAFGCGPPVVYLVPYARSAGLGARRAALLMSAFGVSSIVGNVTFGWITDRKRLRLASYAAAVGVEGLCCAALHLLRSFPLLLPFALLYGYFDGAYVALIPVVTSDIVGSAHLASALGVVYFLHAIPYLISPPIGGWLVDWTGGYAATFSLSAASFVLSSGVLVSALLVRSFQSAAAQQRLL